MANAVRIKELNDKITALEKENTTLKETIAYLTRKLYGRSSETSKNLNIQGQINFYLFMNFQHTFSLDQIYLITKEHNY